MQREDKAAQGGRLSGLEQNQDGDAVAVCPHSTTPSHLLSPTFFYLQRSTDTSFHCDNPAAVLSWLRRHGYADRPTTNPHELARLRNDNAGLAIIYRSGSVVVGGPTKGARQVLALLDRQTNETMSGRSNDDEY
jgi:hypothetical protein